MLSLNHKRKTRAKQRRQRHKIKTKIHQYLLVFALVISLLVLLSGRTEHRYNTNPNSRHLSSSTTHVDPDDGYYINSLNQFPPLLFTLDTILAGAWVVYFVGMFYCFIGIGIVCDCYFVPSIEVIVDKLEISEDTAGATWMAIGNSAPELFTSFVGTFVAESDVGFGTIVGSAVFNIFVVIGMCAVFTSGTLQLQWFPFARDMIYYLLSLGLLAFFFGGISKHKMYWYECSVLLFLYLLYVLMMTKNDKIKEWIYTRFVYTNQEKLKLLTKEDAEISMQRTPQDRYSDETKANSDMSSVSIGCGNTDDEDEDECEGLDMSFPSGCGQGIWYILKAPLTVPIYLTLCDVTKEKSMHWWPWTFVGSVLWLGGLSYLMVWWAVVVGYVLSIPQEVMGLVFLAVGTSVTELFSCIIVAKRGQADMAVSASIGSNIFDVLVGLPLPWLSFAIWDGKGYLGDMKINVQAHGLFLSILLLMTMLTCLLAIILVNKWVLTHCMGYSMVLLYGGFVAIEILRSGPVFGN